MADLEFGVKLPDQGVGDKIELRIYADEHMSYHQLTDQEAVSVARQLLEAIEYG